MRKELYYLLLLFFCSVNVTGQTVMRMKDKVVNPKRWITEHFAQGILPPFSFDYGGKSSVSFIRKWKYSAEKIVNADSQNLLYMYSYADPVTGLRVICEVTGYTDYPVVEWVLHFVNKGTKNSLEISNVKVSDITFRSFHSGKFDIRYANGSEASRSDFNPLLKELSRGDSLYMKPLGGRSSNGVLPFFNIEMPSLSAGHFKGVMAAVGWTGTWFSKMVCIDNKNIEMTSGIARLKTYLYPKESIRTSSICFLFWQGNNQFAGNNCFRRFILAHHTKKIDGKPTVYPLSTGFNWGDPTPCQEYTCLTVDYALALVKRFEQFKIVPEVFWLDAGWYKGAADKNDWYGPTGNWKVDSIRFPEGFRPISDEIHHAGAKFMVWFEPERVMPHTDWATAHSEWMLHINGEKGSVADTKPYLFNLGNLKARKWMSKQIGDLLEDNGIDYYRQDYNINPERYWINNDEQGREGICEIRYIEGLYAYWDYLLERFPHLLIDNCASGGRRIDLETVSRSAPLWRTDYNYGEPNGAQCHTYGLSLYLPQHGTGTMKTDKYSFRSALSSALVTNWKVTDRSFSLNDMHRCLDEFKEIRPYFYEDFYPLSGVDGDITSDKIWLAYQLNRPSDNSGYIIAFRRSENLDKTYTVKLYGLHPQKKYILMNTDTGKTIKKSGEDLLKGFVLTLVQPRSSLIIKYKEASFDKVR